jgi:hypothetical protein
MTRRELFQRTLRALNDDVEAPVYWAPSEIQDYLAEALEVLAEDVPFVKRTFTVPRRPGISVYQVSGISPAIIAPYRVNLPDYQRRLASRTLHAVDARYERWMEAVGIPEVWISLSWDQFLVALHETTSTGMLEVNCYCWPEPLATDDAIPELQPTSQEALVDYAEGLGHLKEWHGQEVVKCWQDFFKKAGHAKAQAAINRVQSRFWARNGDRGDR